MLSVRSQQFADVDVDALGKLIVSVVAGIPTSALAAHTNAERVARAMPNAAASLRKSFTPWFAGATTTASDKALTQQILAACGEAEEVPEERHIDYCRFPDAPTRRAG